MERYPGRFAAFTMSDFAQWDDPVLLRDGFVDDCIRHLEEDVAAGAAGLKVTKELGLRFRDRDGAMLGVDDERLFPIWHRAGELGLPVLIHVSDPAAFFEPIDEHNEHYLTLQEFPGWSFVGSHFSKAALLEQRNRMIAAHPETTFILPHVANHPENLPSVSALLDAHPNVVIDFSARIDELGRQPYTARDFFDPLPGSHSLWAGHAGLGRGVPVLLPVPRNAGRGFRLPRLHRPLRRLHALEAHRARSAGRGIAEDLLGERVADYPGFCHARLMREPAKPHHGKGLLDPPRKLARNAG